MAASSDVLPELVRGYSQQLPALELPTPPQVGHWLVSAFGPAHGTEKSWKSKKLGCDSGIQTTLPQLLLLPNVARYWPYRKNANPMLPSKLPFYVKSSSHVQSS